MVQVFIAEDQELVRLGLRAGLPRAGPIEVIGEADNGRSAVEQCVKQRPSVVLVDLDLPIQGGIETTRSIKRQLPGTRVVIFTSHTDDARVFEAIEAGADAYVVKTSDMTKLVTAIQTVLQGAVWLDPVIALRVMQASTSNYARSDASKQNFEPLSDREKQIVTMIAAGSGNQAIAKKLYLSLDTVKTHIRHVMHKTHANNRTEAAVKAIKYGLLE
jgi:NarL family two-component system response regulator LiaR